MLLGNFLSYAGFAPSCANSAITSGVNASAVTTCFGSVGASGAAVCFAPALPTKAFAFAKSAGLLVASIRIQGADLPGFAVPCPMRARTFWPTLFLSAFLSATLKNKTLHF